MVAMAKRMLGRCAGRGSSGSGAAVRGCWPGRVSWQPAAGSAVLEGLGGGVEQPGVNARGGFSVLAGVVVQELSEGQWQPEFVGDLLGGPAGPGQRPG